MIYITFINNILCYTVLCEMCCELARSWSPRQISVNYILFYYIVLYSI